MREFLTNRTEQLLESLKTSKSLCGFGAWWELDIYLLLLLGLLASNPCIFFMLWSFPMLRPIYG
ncbi:hypothetical protein HU200_045769 [Digitaria exilis]|uniref:Uncharacterized protein n=1 Tax=Digitaria exilis TaxID=1010633 RepID=A0A835AZH2_9POAL|nr:hypothetical protein HU200_045768 [Digitaria exilis]KAF8680600.1 hypothetical protein HU200_045769 [Digitaria exilis]